MTKSSARLKKNSKPKPSKLELIAIGLLSLSKRSLRLRTAQFGLGFRYCLAVLECQYPEKQPYSS